ncbi:MAG: cytochrome c oxidase subunit II [Planctomycetota bacterium]
MNWILSTFERLWVTALFLAVPILGVWTWVIADRYGWWFPENVSSYGDQIDHLFYVIMWMVAVTFVITEVVLAIVILYFTERKQGRSTYTHGSHKLELIWTAVPALLLVFIAFSQMEAWNDVKIDLPRGVATAEVPYTVDEPIFDVWASQFDWRVRYPDENGNFEGAGVIESPYDIYVPVDTRVVFRLRSRDVLHSFFVPNFRLKQDAVPGMAIPVWFEAQKTGSYDLICAELCGWGHYKMAGRVHVLPKDEYAAWLATARREHRSNGADDLVALGDGDDDDDE